MSRTKKVLLAVGATLLIGLLIVVICGSSGWRNWDFDTWFNYWGKGNSVHVHMEVTDYGKSPTCTESGLTDGKHCFTCNAITIKQQSIPATGHTEVAGNGKAATCTESGLTDGKHCSVCNVITVEQQVIPATGHTEVAGNGKAATCTESGLTDGKHCSVCNAITVEQQVIPATGHTEVASNGKIATCIESGLTDGKHCSTCGTITVEQQVIPTIPHNYVYGVCSACGQENPNPVLDNNGFYLVGSMNGWNWTSDKYKFVAVATDIAGVTSQYKLTITLAAGTEFKVWNGNDSYYDSFESVDYIEWTDNGTGIWNPMCTETGMYNFYLKFYSDGSYSIYCEIL